MNIENIKIIDVDGQAIEPAPLVLKPADDVILDGCDIHSVKLAAIAVSVYMPEFFGDLNDLVMSLYFPLGENYSYLPVFGGFPSEYIDDYFYEIKNNFTVKEVLRLDMEDMYRAIASRPKFKASCTAVHERLGIFMLCCAVPFVEDKRFDAEKVAKKILMASMYRSFLDLMELLLNFANSDQKRRLNDGIKRVIKVLELDES